MSGASHRGDLPLQVLMVGPAALAASACLVAAVAIAPNLIPIILVCAALPAWHVYRLARKRATIERAEVESTVGPTLLARPRRANWLIAVTTLGTPALSALCVVLGAATTAGIRFVALGVAAGVAGQVIGLCFGRLRGFRPGEVLRVFGDLFIPRSRRPPTPRG